MDREKAEQIMLGRPGSVAAQAAAALVEVVRDGEWAVASDGVWMVQAQQSGTEPEAPDVVTAVARAHRAKVPPIEASVIEVDLGRLIDVLGVPAARDATVRLRIVGQRLDLCGAGWTASVCGMRPAAPEGEAVRP